MPKAYSTFQAAKILGVSPPTVIKWANDGKIKSYRTPGGHRRILDSVLKDFLASYQSDEQAVDVSPKVVLFIQDEDYGLLIEEFFDNPKSVIQCRTPFQLGWQLSKGDATHVLWDWYENTVDALRLLSEIKSHPHLSNLCIIGFIPSYEQLNPSFVRYFDEKTTKSLALQNLRTWIGNL